MPIQLKVPSLGESVTQATVGAWLKKEGDPVQVDEPLVEVESEKATVAIPAPAAGVLRRVLRGTGDTVTVGEVIAEVEEGAAARPASPAQPPAAPAPGPVTASPVPARAANAPVSASPAPAAPPAQVHELPVRRAPPSVRRRLAEQGLAEELARPAAVELLSYQFTC